MENELKKCLFHVQVADGVTDGLHVPVFEVRRSDRLGNNIIFLVFYQGKFQDMDSSQFYPIL